MNAWPKLVSEEMLHSSINEMEIGPLTVQRHPPHFCADFSSEPSRQEAWRAIGQDHRHDILRSASRLQGALQDLLAALHAGAGEGLYQSFVDHFLKIDTPLHRLLVALGNGNPAHAMAFPNTLLATQFVPGPDGDASKCSSTLSWNLSRKEVLVLHLIRLGLSNKGIAREMQITPETVKSHIKRIFIKLGSKNRIEAVSKATDLGFL